MVGGAPGALGLRSIHVQAFGVRATTTTMVIDSKRILRYFGKFDDRRGREAYTGNAVKAILEGQPVVIKETRPVG